MKSTRSFDFGRTMEALEKRVMLAANAGLSRTPPVYVAPTSTDVADVKNGPMSTAGEQVIDLYRSYRKFRSTGGVDANFTSELSDLMLLKQNKVGVTVRGRGTLDQLTQKLRDAGAEIIFRNGSYTLVDAFVPIARLHDLAVDPTIANLHPIYRGQTQQEGIANNQADVVLKTQQVRAIYGLDGSGVTVGVISDSVNLFRQGIAGSVATGDLPDRGVNVIADSPIGGTDEGRAMLELIHDMAPGADLAFATADFGIQAFADYVRQLRNAGSDVIVDDIKFFTEPMYQPSIIDQAIGDVVRDGAVYLSSAGNQSAEGGLEVAGNFSKVGQNRFVDFDSTSRVDTQLRVRITEGGRFYMTWDEPYNGVVGNATTDLDVYVYDTVYHRKFHIGRDNNIKTGIPGEFGFSIPAGNWDLEIVVVDQVPGAPLPTRIRLAGEGSDFLGRATFEFTEHPVLNKASVFGHNAGENTISVGAVPFHTPAENELFSSGGPVTLTLDANGNRLPSPITLQKPDISGIDDTNTSFFPDNGPTRLGFPQDSPFDSDVLPNFTGTSAAAPNVAALVALFVQADPTATQAQILDSLQATAIALNGAPTGSFDPQGGFGLVDGLAAATAFIAPPTADIVDIKPDPTDQPVESIKVVFSQRVTGFNITDVVLSRDGSTNLLSGGQTVRTTDNGRSYLLRHLSDLTTPNGTYTLTVVSAASGIQNGAQLGLENNVTETWTKIDTPTIPSAPSSTVTKVISPTQIRVRWSDNSINEDGFTLQRAENDDFTIGVKNFNIAANTAVFTDTVPVPAGKHYFYRVRAFSNFSGFSSFSNIAEAFTPVAGEKILDNSSSSGFKVFGTWSEKSVATGALNGSALDDLNSGKGTKHVLFTPNLEFTDDYFVYARWVKGSNRATNVLYDVFFGPGGADHRTITVNQRDTGGDGWVLLGKFRMEQGAGAKVRVRTFGTDGFVSVDSVRFLPANGR